MNEKNMKRAALGLLLASLLVCGAIMTVLINYTNTKNDTEARLFEETVGLGTALNDCGWTLYTDSRCSACQVQEGILGYEYFYITRIELGKEDVEKAFEEGTIEGLPTWYNWYTQETILGVQYPEALWNMTNGKEYHLGINETEVLLE